MKKFNISILKNIFLVLMGLFTILELHIFYNSYATLIRVIILLIFFGMSLVLFSNKKDRLYLSFYFILSFIYVGLHLFFSGDNIYLELLYFLKMFSWIFTTYSVIKLDIDYDKSIKVIKCILLFITISIIFCNIFKLGYSSYSFEGIKYNIFDWFRDEPMYFEYSSGKGYFHLANQIVAIVLLYYPFIIIDVKKMGGIINLILMFSSPLSLLIIGNRAGSTIPLIILIISFIMYSFFCIIKKDKFNFKFLIILLSSIVFVNIFLFNSPILSREDYYDELVSDNVSGENTDKDENPELETTRDILNSKDLNMNFIDIYYPYEQDKEFWDDLSFKDISFENSRLIETLIASRIKDLSDSKYKDLFGVGYNRIIRVSNVERDYVMQYYTIGILGIIIFLGGYFVLYLYFGFKIFVNLENRFNFKYLMFMLALGVNLFLAYFSGNMLNAVSNIIPLSFVLGIVYNEFKVCKSSKVLGFKVCSLDKEDIIVALNKSNKCNILFNINPLIMCNFYKNKDIKRFINSYDYNIADGYGTILGLRFKENFGYKQITGVDMFNLLIDNSVNNKKKVYLYGASKNVIKMAVKNL